MKHSKRHIYKRWQSSSKAENLADEEKLLEMTAQTHHEYLSDLEFDPSLQRITSNWPGFELSADGKHALSPTSDGYSTPSSTAPANSQILTPTSPTRQLKPSSPRRRIKRIFTKFPFRDPSWLTASSFTIGSSVFVVNGFFLLLPMVQPGWNFEGEGTYAGPATSLVGSIIFLIGGWTAILEALNLNRGSIESNEIGEDTEEDEYEKGKGNGTASPRVLEPNTDNASIRASDTSSDMEKHLRPTILTVRPAHIGSSAFIWYPSMSELLETYTHDALFIAAIIQMIGAVIFGISIIANVPGVLDLTNIIVLYGLSLLPTLVGGVCFLVAALIQTVYVQDKWYIPTPWKLEWHAGFWNCVGSIGFALAGGLPFIGAEATFQATLADFWGSWGFMIGSAIQWYAVMGNYP